MKEEYRLISVEYNGKTYSNAFISIDTDAGKIEVQRTTRLPRRRRALVATLSFDSRSKVSVEGQKVGLQSLTMVAPNEKDAAEIWELLRGPAEKERKIIESETTVWKSVVEFLELREEVIVFLLRLRENPRKASLSLAATWDDRETPPAEQYLSRKAGLLSKSFENLKDTLAIASREGGAETAMKICAFVYASGLLQDALLNSNPDPSYFRDGFAEFGVEVTAAVQPGIEGLSERLLTAVRPSLFPNVPAEKQHAP